MVDVRENECYVCMNIRELLDPEQTGGIGESGLQEILSDFSSPKNMDVEHFLRKNAIEFTKKNQSITYLVFSQSDMNLVGYFSITVKPVKFYADGVSNSVKKKLDRLSKRNEADNSYTVAAYLIAQLGKNYSGVVEEPIAGTELMNFAIETLHSIQYQLGGLMVYLECEDKEVLLNFYKNKNGFRVFGERMAEGTEEPYRLIQLMSFL